MNHAYQFKNYLLKRQVFALAGKFRIYGPNDELLLFSQQKMFKLREDIRVFNDESKSQELLLIQARSIIDFSAAYDVIDSPSGQKIGALRRKGLRSMLQDEWEVLDTQDQVVGTLFEDNMGLALLRRFLLGSLLPQNYDMKLGQERVADLRQKFNPFAYQLMLDFSMDTGNRLDRRIGLAAAILLATIECKQSGSALPSPNLAVLSPAISSQSCYPSGAGVGRVLNIQTASFSQRASQFRCWPASLELVLNSKDLSFNPVCAIHSRIVPCEQKQVTTAR